MDPLHRREFIKRSVSTAGGGMISWIIEKLILI
jgi:hypothetical protein